MFYHIVCAVVCIVAAVGCNGAMILGVDAVVRELVDPVMVRDAARVGGESVVRDAARVGGESVVRDAARVGGESVVRDAVDDVSSGGSGSSSSSIQGLYIPGGKFILCLVCLPFYIVYNYCFTILYVRLFVLLQQCWL